MWEIKQIKQIKSCNGWRAPVEISDHLLDLVARHARLLDRAVGLRRPDLERSIFIVIPAEEK